MFKKVTIFLIFLCFLTISYGASSLNPLTKPYADTLYCQIGGTCNVTNFYVTNKTEVKNMTVYDYICSTTACYSLAQLNATSNLSNYPTKANLATNISSLNISMTNYVDGNFIKNDSDARLKNLFFEYSGETETPLIYKIMDDFAGDTYSYFGGMDAVIDSNSMYSKYDIWTNADYCWNVLPKSEGNTLMCIKSTSVNLYTDLDMNARSILNAKNMTITEDLNVGRNLNVAGLATFGDTFQAQFNDADNGYAGYLTDGTNSIQIANGMYIIDAYGEADFHDTIGNSAALASSSYAVYGYKAVGGTAAGYYLDTNGNSVELANGQEGIKVTGSSSFQNVTANQLGLFNTPINPDYAIAVSQNAKGLIRYEANATADNQYIFVINQRGNTGKGAGYDRQMAILNAYLEPSHDFPDEWLTATLYHVGDLVWNMDDGDGAYRCLIEHTSGDFLDDVDSGYWELLPENADGLGSESRAYVVTAIVNVTGEDWSGDNNVGGGLLGGNVYITGDGTSGYGTRINLYMPNTTSNVAGIGHDLTINSDNNPASSWNGFGITGSSPGNSPTSLRTGFKYQNPASGNDPNNQVWAWYNIDSDSNNALNKELHGADKNYYGNNYYQAYIQYDTNANKFYIVPNNYGTAVVSFLNGSTETAGNHTANSLITLGTASSGERLTNGNFSGNANNWTFSTASWTYVANSIRHSGSSVLPLNQSTSNMTIPFVAGTYYRLDFKVINVTVSNSLLSSVKACGDTLTFTTGTNYIYVTNNSYAAYFKCNNPVQPLSFTTSSAARFNLANISITKVRDGNLIISGKSYLDNDVYAKENIFVTNNATIGQAMLLTNLTALPTCNTKGMIASNNSGVYVCNSTTWKSMVLY